MKLEYIVVYENSSDEFNIEHHLIKVNFTVGLQKFPHLPQYKLSGPLNQILVQARKLILGMHVHLIVIYKIYEYHNA